MATVEPVESDRYLTFWVDSQLYALPAAGVSEVVRLATVARVPQGPPALLGLANLRGSVIPVIGLRELLRQVSQPGGADKLALVLDQASPSALVVDSVDALESMPADQIETTHALMDAGPFERLLGTFRIERSSQVARLLDIRAMLAAAFSPPADDPRPARSRRSIAVGAIREAEPADSQMLLTFDVAGQEFAMPLDVVEEILPFPSGISTMTQTDSVSLGFVAVRESVMPLLSLRGLLGFDVPDVAPQRRKVIVVTVKGASVGLVADAAHSVVTARIDAMEAVPPVLAARTGGEARIKAVYRGDAGRRLISVLAPEQLFREDVMQRLSMIQEDSGTAVQPAGGHGEEDLSFLVFRLGDDEFALPIDSVVEVAQVPPQITRIPRAPKFLDGVVNLRGDVLPVVDQRRRFEMPKLERTEGRRLVVIKTLEHRAGIIVDSVSEVLRASPESISPPPDLNGQISRLVRGVINLDRSDRLILLLDPAELLTRTEQGQLDSFQAKSVKVRA